MTDGEKVELYEKVLNELAQWPHTFNTHEPEAAAKAKRALLASGAHSVPATSSNCQGCYNDYYNRNVNGGCWSLSKAKMVVKYRTGVWDDPTKPGAFTKVTAPDCYRKEGFVFVTTLPACAQGQ
jgi:hypothetical protein